MEINKIYNEDCFVTMNRMVNDECYVDNILTSPFYNTNKKSSNKSRLNDKMLSSGKFPYCRYDVHVDDMNNDEYIEYTIKLFNMYDKVLKPNGCVIYNLSYGSENSNCMFETVASIIQNTSFMIADTITWKKKTACPNNMSSNRLTRITEYIFVFCRKSESHTFIANKKVVSVRKTGQKNYENISNYIEAKNNDEQCPYNKATFSSELCLKLFDIYVPINKSSVIYDSFMGTGTTAVAAVKYGINYIGSEISENQCKWANERISKLLLNLQKDVI